MNDISSSKQWFDYIPEMNIILNFEIPLQTNNSILNHQNNTIINKLTSNSIDNLSKQSFIIDQHQILEKQFNNISIETRAYEYSAIFEDVFDQLNIIHHSLLKKQFLSKTNNNNCNQFEILKINEDENICSEIRYFSHHLILLFRAFVYNKSDELINTINKTQNKLLSKNFIDLNNRLQKSQDQINQFQFIRKHFHQQTFEQFKQLDSIKAKLNDHFIEEKFRMKITHHYANNWKQNHLLQWIEMLFQLEQNSIKIIRQYEQIFQQSNFLHQQTIQFLIQQRNQLKFDSNHWYEYYQNETTRFERELIDYRYEFKQLKIHREQLYIEYQRMKLIVDEYHQMKIQENILFDKQKREQQAIEQIQTWWRGIMIRYFKRKNRKKRPFLLK